MPKASIIITTHERPHLLPRAVASARASSADVEIVVVDDAGNDETEAVARSLSDIVYVRVRRNQGVAGARNVGLASSHGQYLSFLDDDDTRLAGSLDRQIESLEREPLAALAYAPAIIGDQDGQPTETTYPDQCPQGDVFWKLLVQNFIPCGTVVFRRSCLAHVGLLDQHAAGIDDWDLWVRLSELKSVIASDSPSIIWRRPTPWSGQGSSDAARLVRQSIQQFWNVWMNLPRAASASRSRRNEAWKRFCENMAAHLIWESGRAFRHGRPLRAAENLSVVPRLHPLTLPRLVSRQQLKI